MKTLIRLIPVLCFAAGFFSSNLRAGEGGDQPAGIITVPEGAGAQTVQKAIVTAGMGRGWTVKSREDGTVVLFLEHGGWRSTLTLTYDTKEISISSNSDKLDRHGNPKKHAVPKSWVKYLTEDINKNLASSHKT